MPTAPVSKLGVVSLRPRLVKNQLIYLGFLVVVAGAVWLRRLLRQRRAEPAFPTVHLAPAPLPEDVVLQVQRDFSDGAERVLQRLSSLRSEDSRLFGDRVTRCIVFCTHHYAGTTLEHWVEQARLDPRDLIMAAEYDRANRQLRDFNLPFDAAHIKAR